MVKEKLTIDAIKQELKKERKQWDSLLCGCLFILLVLALLTAWMVKLGGLLIALAIVFGGLMLLPLMFFVSLIIDIIKLQNVLKRKICMVKDKLVGMEEDYWRSGEHVRDNRKIYHLHFAEYGEYTIVGTHSYYTWSSVYGPMSAKGVYTYSHCGDEFYLVLSKPHNGKILRVYNTNLFDFEEE